MQLPPGTKVLLLHEPVPQVVPAPYRRHAPAPLQNPSVPQVANPLNFSATPLTYTQAPPLLGEHTEAVLAGRLGLSKQSLADLVARGIVQVNE